MTLYSTQQFLVFFSVIIGLITGGLTITFLIGIEDFKKSPALKWVNGILAITSFVILIPYSTTSTSWHLLFFIATGLINLAMISIPLYQEYCKTSQEWTKHRESFSVKAREITLPIPTKENLAHRKHHEGVVTISYEEFEHVDILGGTQQEVPQYTVLVGVS